MARPIKETPTLTGKDAVRFIERMNTVDNMSMAQREANTNKLKAAVAEASKTITLSI